MWLVVHEGRLWLLLVIVSEGSSGCGLSPSALARRLGHRLTIVAFGIEEGRCRHRWTAMGLGLTSLVMRGSDGGGRLIIVDNSNGCWELLSVPESGL